ncbi:MAG: hypothetical protein M0R80_28665 [Proteobacteria bacterium]|jgi:hypothetical protein|nr:hypothetical protein [Pseudomonadota bacterium]
MRRARTPFALLAVMLVASTANAAPPKRTLDAFYDRLAADLAAGRPLVITVHVALCDNDSQGIIPVKNRSICRGDDPANNMYWATRGGLAGYLKRAGWKRVLLVAPAGGPVLLRAAWHTSLVAGGALADRGVLGRIPVVVVGLAYRGREIRTATVDYFHAVHRDDPRSVALDTGETIAAGGASHVVGYVGHDYFYDTSEPEALLAEAAGNSALAKGAFALSCTGDRLIRPGLVRPNVRILLLNRTLAFPGAWTVGGIARGLASGQNGAGIRREAAAAFSLGMGVPYGAALGGFAYGD